MNENVHSIWMLWQTKCSKCLLVSPKCSTLQKGYIKKHLCILYKPIHKPHPWPGNTGRYDRFPFHHSWRGNKTKGCLGVSKTQGEREREVPLLWNLTNQSMEHYLCNRAYEHYPPIGEVPITTLKMHLRIMFQPFLPSHSHYGGCHTKAE